MTEQTTASLTDEVYEWIQRFKDVDGKHVYFERISQMIDGTTRLQISFPDLTDSLALKLRNKPTEVLKSFNDALDNILQDIHPDYAMEMHGKFKVSLVDLDPEQSRRLDIEYVDKLIAIVGKVQGIGDVQQVMLEAAWRCENCGTVTKSAKKMNLRKCPKCSEEDLQLDFAQCKVANQCFHQVSIMTLNKSGKEYVEPDNPSLVWLDLRDDLVDYDLFFEDQLVITGIVRLSKTQGTQPVKEVSTSFLYLEVNSISNIHRIEEEDATLDNDDIIRLEGWEEKQGENLMPNLVEAHCPRVFGFTEIKEALLYQAVGSEITNSDERDTTNILIIGDTGLAKTELSKRQVEITGGIYQAGEGLSGVGITAGLIKDEKTGKWSVQAGFAVRGHGKLKALDEIDKMRRDYITQLSTVMESQFYPLGRIKNRKLPAKGPWLTTGNPLYGSYDPYKNVTDNINLPTWLLSRFDLIFIIRDGYDKDTTDKILDKIDNRSVNQTTSGPDILGTADLQKYIKLAKQRKDVTFDANALDALHTYYHALKRTEEKAGMVITPRQYLGLKRLAIARAKIHLRGNVTKVDVERAIFIMNYALAKVGIDVSTGMPDLGVLDGKPQTEVSRLKKFMNCFNELSGEGHEEVKKDDLIARLEKEHFNTENALHCITKALREGLIYERRQNVYLRS